LLQIKTKYYLILFLLCYFVFPSISQNLEKLGKKDMIGISGGLNFNSIFLNTNNPNSTRDPFSWYLNGNLNISILDWSLPFTYSYSNQHGTYTQPFNQYGITPTYKWVKTYMGWSNMNFSSYTFSAYPFLGGGVELTPNNWKIAFMYGRLKKAVEFDAINEVDREMSFKRIGMGAMLGYEKKGYGVNLIWFQAKDDKNSLHFIPEVTQVQPQENTVISATAKASVIKSITVQAEYALSGFTRNAFADEISNKEIKNKIPFIFNQRTTSQFFAAYKSSVNYNSKIFSCGINYERVAPDYKTLGIFYINNDLENITLSPQVRLLKSKLNISLNTGVQKNNLNEQKLSTMRRVVGSGNISYQPNQHWAINTSYSNFSSFTRNRPNTDPFYQPSPADTMRFYQLSQNANASVNYNWGNEKQKKVITSTVSYQVSSQQTGETKSEPTQVVNTTLGYVCNFIKSKTILSINANANTSRALNTTNTYYGPGINIGKPLYTNKLMITFSTIYNLAFYNQQKNGAVLNERLSITINPKIKNVKLGKPNISLSASYVSRINSTVANQKLNEFTGNVNLGYTFYLLFINFFF